LKKNATRHPFGTVARAVAILAALLGILSLPWRSDRPASTPSVAGVKAGRGALSAGAAVRIIEPGPSPVIGGFPRFQWAAVGARDPISARAVVLAEPGCAVAIASAEILLVPEALAAAVRTRVADLALDAVVVGATHTHAGPGGYWDSLAGELGATGWYDQATFDRIADTLAGAIRDAAAARGPATLAVTRGREPSLVRSRTGAAEDGRLLSVRLARLDGAPVAELITFAAHPTMLGKRNRALSGDWVSALLAEAPRGPRLFFQAAIGDQSVRPRPLAGVDGAEPAVDVADPVTDYGRAVGEALATLPPPQSPAAPAPSLAVASATVALPPLSVLAVPAWLRPAVRTVGGGLLPEVATVTAVRLGGALLVFDTSDLSRAPRKINVPNAGAFGASWSPDGTRIAFMEKSFGDAYEIDVKTRVIRLLTHYPHPGFLRVQYLPNGDYFLIGAPTFTDIEAVSWRSTNTFHCWVNCGRRFRSKARTWPDGVVPGTSSAKPVVIVPGPVDLS